MKTSVDELLQRVKRGEAVSFQETIAAIDGQYRYTPCRFFNGLGEDRLVNEAGSNEGSCKIFWFARLSDLDQAETLALFGDYYRRDVLERPEGESHANIRRFLRDGWDGISYDGVPLEPVSFQSPR